MVATFQNVSNMIKANDRHVICGKDLKNMFLKAYEMFQENLSIVNMINVFPVPDGDTGLNIYETLRAIKEELDDLDDSASCGSVIEKIAFGSFNGSLGNSGVILSEYLHGFEIAWKDLDYINLENLKTGLQKGCECAYESMVTPKEGTILTIQRRIADHAKELDSTVYNPFEALVYLFIESKKALLDTHYILQEINKAKTIDAGALAFVLIWESFITAVFDEDIFMITSRTLNSEIKPFLKVNLDELVMDQEWEVVFNINSIKRSIDSIKNSLRNEGECLIITNNHDSMDYKIHIHIKKPTNDFVKKIKDVFGKISNIQITDLKTQSSDFLEMNDE